MINILIVTHGEFGAYMMEAAESIAGRQDPGVRVIAISPRIAVGEIRERIKKSLAELMTPEGLILFTDMPGGTPNNVSFPLIKDCARVEIISGINLYMLISAFIHRGKCSLEELVDKVIADGQKAICDMRRMFLSKSK